MYSTIDELCLHKGLTWLMEYSHCGTMYVLIIWNMEIVKQELHITFQKKIFILRKGGVVVDLCELLHLT